MKKIIRGTLLLAMTVSIMVAGFVQVNMAISANANVQVGDTTEKEFLTTAASVATTTAIVTTSTPVQEVPDSNVRVICAGDNLIHSSIYKQAHSRSLDGTYDFDFAYENVQDIIAQGDISIINQETIIANNIYPPSSYPMFNSPTQLGDKMLSLGFDVFNHANNHILDKGTSGAMATLDYWDTKKDAAIITGVYRDKQDMDNIRIKESNGAVFSFLGFTEHTNGLSIPQDSLMKVIGTSQEDIIKEQIISARAKSDVVVVSVHWGNENSNIVAERQKTLAKNMADWGADVIIGTHPHVVQPVEFIKSSDGRDVLVAYSLGNFISAQSVGNNLIGGILDFTVNVNRKDDTISINDVKFIPIVTQYEGSYKNIRIYPFAEYTKELASSHGVTKVGTSAFGYEYIKNVLKQYISPEFLVMD